MKRLICTVLTSLVFLVAYFAPAAQFKFPTQTLTVPDGFTVELIAGPPLVDRPIEADFDELGRLYVSDSSGFSGKAEEQYAKKSHRIRRLEDTDGDGRFDKGTLFADQMMFPEGILWFDGAVYCGAPPTIWKLEDRNNDGVAEVRTEWFKGGTMTGCANDLHGPYLGLDGCLYWAKGAFAKQTHERPGRKPISDSAAHIFRCRPDGTGLDSVMSGGMDNPVGIAFTPAGEVIFTTTFYTNPNAGLRDALVHAIYGGVYPKVHGVLDGLTRTGDLMPAMTHLGPSAPCGITRYESRIFGGEFQDNLFSCEFNLHKVQRHILEPVGATFQTKDSDFLVSDNPDFHPTDVFEDADGSLIVIDTGGWYRICCPTSQIAKPDVMGGIYRIRRAGATKVRDPRGLKLNWPGISVPDLVKLLGDERPAVQSRALAALAKHGESAVAALGKSFKPSNSVLARRNAVWALTRIDAPSARLATRMALVDRDPSVRQAAVHSAGLHRDGAVVRELANILKTGSPHLQRAAATALGQIARKTAVPALLAAAATEHDRALEHALIYALIEIEDREGTAAGLKAGSAFTRRAALIALDQMGGALRPDAVVPLLTSTDATLKKTAMWIASLHPDWGKDLAGFFRQRLSAATLAEAERSELQSQLAQFASDSTIQELVATTLADAATPPARRVLLLHTMARASLKQAPVAWTSEVKRCLGDADEAVLRAALNAVSALPIGKKELPAFTEPLLAIARNGSLPGDARLHALAALPAGLRPVDADLFAFLRSYLDPARPPMQRTAAAGVIAQAKLSEEQLLALTELLPAAGPMELTKLLGAFAGSTSESVGLRFIAALKEAKGVSVLRPDSLKPVLAKFPPAVQEAGRALLQTLTPDVAKQKARLDELEAALAGGDQERGHLIFNSPRAVCSTCHTIGYLGGKVGPDLTRIGQIRTERDLLESIVYPSSNFVRSYEPTIVRTKDGEDHSGVLREESGDSVALVSGAGTEERFARTDIVEIRPGTVSIMPEGLDQQLSKQEMADLVAFLRSLK